jgi:hypothetical protein
LFDLEQRFRRAITPAQSCELERRLWENLRLDQMSDAVFDAELTKANHIDGHMSTCGSAVDYNSVDYDRIFRLTYEALEKMGIGDEARSDFVRFLGESDTVECDCRLWVFLELFAGAQKTPLPMWNHLADMFNLESASPIDTLRGSVLPGNVFSDS